METISNKVVEQANLLTTAVKDTLVPRSGEKIVKGYMCFGPKQRLREHEFEAKPLKPTGVDIRITHCGVCHTDVSLIKNDFGFTVSTYPIVPGHEIVGIVTAVGSEVGQEVRVGQRVGVGWFIGSCGECQLCQSGADNLCKDAQPTCCMGSYGGWAGSIRADKRWVFPIPDNIPSEQAAPLLCAGVTVFSPLIQYNIKAGMKVGVVGLGGLGHLFTQYAHAMGCEVTVFSTSEDKERYAAELGANRFVLTTSALPEDTKESLDFLLNTTYGHLDWSAWLNTLKWGGTLCVVGWPDPMSKTIDIPPFELIYKQRKVVGSNVGSSQVTRQMLEFSSKHNIKPKIELFTIHKINEVLDKFNREGFHFRAVCCVDHQFDAPAQSSTS